MAVSPSSGVPYLGVEVPPEQAGDLLRAVAARLAPGEIILGLVTTVKALPTLTHLGLTDRRILAFRASALNDQGFAVETALAAVTSAYTRPSYKQREFLVVVDSDGAETDFGDVHGDDAPPVLRIIEQAPAPVPASTPAHTAPSALPVSGWRFNPPPTWPPAPPGWTPPPGWQPDPSWPPPPQGWQLWVPAAAPIQPPPQPVAPHAPAPIPAPSAASEYVGVNGRILLERETLILVRSGLRSRMVGHAQESRRIPFQAISDVRYKEAGRMVNGYLQLGLGGVEPQALNAGNAASDPDTVLFTWGKRSDFEQLRARLQQVVAINRASGIAPATVPYDGATPTWPMKLSTSPGAGENTTGHQSAADHSPPTGPAQSATRKGAARKQRARPVADPPKTTPSRLPKLVASPAHVGSGAQQPSAARWLRPGEACRVAERVLPGGMLYVGTGLAAASGQEVEPALVDPRLPVDWDSPDWGGKDLGYWPSYAEISPQERAAFLRWLEGGRQHRDVSVGYAFLFLYGLERRVLVDLQENAAARSVEMPLIRDEVARLLGLFGSNGSFRGYATEFCALLEARTAADGGASVGPVPDADRVRPSPRLRIGLGEFARSNRPLPAEWALHWVMSHPGYFPRTAAKRCSEEFATLFALRYEDRHLGGFHLRPTGPQLTFSYRPASGGFRGLVRVDIPGVPDVFDQALPLRRLGSLADECAEDLDAFSRLMGRDPELRGSLAASALLPEELLDLGTGAVGAFVEWARSRLGGFTMSAVPAAELLDWTGADRPGKKEVIALARILGRAGIGLEPDPRFGGPVPKGGSVVFFHVEDISEAAPSRAYRAATLLLHLGAAVTLADGDVAVEEKQLLLGHLEGALYLTSDERARLRAHLRWLLTTGVKLTGLTRRVEDVDQTQREHLADFLSAVAAADGRIDPAEVKTLRRIAKLLGLAPERMDGGLRAATTAAPPASAPVTVRPGRPEPGHAVPEPSDAPAPMIRLDESLLAARIAEAAEVSALLGSVFGEDPAPAPPPAPPEVAPVAGLDGPHSRLIRALREQPLMTRAVWEDLAGRHRVMPDGAIDRLNEAAYEATGEPVLEGDDPLEINLGALEAML
ncbi:hypothetical protein GCM10010182_66940 [Actinomadura cremea]|nr:hypothetical protein GCM10010182_66940 [Actinomadura cremea]